MKTPDYQSQVSDVVDTLDRTNVAGRLVTLNRDRNVTSFSGHVPNALVTKWWLDVGALDGAELCTALRSVRRTVLCLCGKFDVIPSYDTGAAVIAVVRRRRIRDDREICTRKSHE